MRLLALTVWIVVMPLSLAFAQTSFVGPTIGAVVRAERISVEAGGHGTVPVLGAVVTLPFSAGTAFEAELTQAMARFDRSYTGTFVSYVQSPNPTREEIERFAPVARRTLGYDPRIGWSLAFIARGALSPRVGLSARIGASGRRYRQTSHYDVLSMPDGVEPARVERDFQDSASTKIRGGLLLGFDVPVVVTRRLSLVPELRYVWGGPAQVGNKHREFGAGLHLVWNQR
jgi:hypothetical protein